MTETIHVDLVHHGKDVPLEVERLGKAARARFLAMYPHNGGVDMDYSDQECVEWFVEVTEWATALSEQEIMSLPAPDMLSLCSEVVKVAMDLEDPEPTSVPTDGWMVVQR